MKKFHYVITNFLKIKIALIQNVTDFDLLRCYYDLSSFV